MLIIVETVGEGGIHVFAQLFSGSKTVIFNLSSSSSFGCTSCYVGSQYPDQGSLGTPTRA